MPDVLPPYPFEPKRSAGYLGYYTRRYLGETFDLMDLDGCWPAIWIYRKAETGVFRYFEEKPHGQDLHGSQNRILRQLARRKDSAAFVIWDAERLAHDPPSFPLLVTRLAPTVEQDQQHEFPSAVEFNRWLLQGFAPLQQLLEMPFSRPAGVPEHVDWDSIDVALTKLALALGPEVQW